MAMQSGRATMNTTSEAGRSLSQRLTADVGIGFFAMSPTVPIFGAFRAGTQAERGVDRRGQRELFVVRAAG